MKNYLSNNPQNITEECWFYEDPDGIEIIHELTERPAHPLRIKIKWRKLIASVHRYEAGKAERSKKRKKNETHNTRSVP